MDVVNCTACKPDYCACADFYGGRLDYWREQEMDSKTPPLTTPLAEMIREAKKARACKEALANLRALERRKPGRDLASVTRCKNAPYWAYWYAHDVIKGRWLEAEPVIATYPTWAYMYACNVIKRRCPEAEPVIATHPTWAYMYACNVIKRRWPEAEPVIATHPRWAYVYACNVIDLPADEASAWVDSYRAPDPRAA